MVAPPDGPAPHSHAAVALSLLCYCSCSIWMILLNKLVVDTFKLDYPMGLIFIQNGCALLLVLGAKQAGLIHFPEFDAKVAKRWLPLTVLFVLMLWTSMKSLKTMSVAVQTICKNVAIVLTAFGDAYFFKKQLNSSMFGAFGLIVLGSYLGSASDKWVTTEGMLWTGANVVTTVMYVLYMNDLLKHVSKDIGRYGPVFYNNLLSLPFLFLPSCLTLRSLLTDIKAAPWTGIGCLVAMVLVGSVMTFTTFWCMSVTSPTTYSVTGALNKIPLAFLGIFIFSHYPTAMGYFGIASSLGGGAWYAYLNRPKPKPSVIDLEDGGAQGTAKVEAPFPTGDTDSRWWVVTTRDRGDDL